MSDTPEIKRTISNVQEFDEWTRLVEDGLARGYTIERSVSDADKLIDARSIRTQTGW